MVHSTATNKQLRKLAATYTYCNLWIRAVTSCKVTGLSRHPGLGQGWMQDAEPRCHRVVMEDILGGPEPLELCKLGLQAALPMVQNLHRVQPQR